MKQDGDFDLGSTLSLTHVVGSAFETKDGNVVDALFAVAAGLDRIADAIDGNLMNISIALETMADATKNDRNRR